METVLEWAITLLLMTKMYKRRIQTEEVLVLGKRKRKRKRKG
jgi:hypothetical protein